MKRINYSETHVRTGDAIADAVVTYAAALAQTGEASRVSIPVRADDGAETVANLLVGPASQIVVEDLGHDDDELEDQAVVDDLRERTIRLGSPQPMVTRASDLYAPGDERSGRWDA